MKKEIRSYTFREDAKIGFEIVDLGEVYARRRSEMTAPHRTDFYHILWIESGVQCHFVDFQSIELQPFTLLFVNKDAVHCFERVEQIAGKGIVFLDSFFCRSEQDTAFLHNTLCFNNFRAISRIAMKENCIGLKNGFVALMEEFQKPDPLYHAALLRNLLHNFLILSERMLRSQDDFEALPAGIDMEYTIGFRNLLNDHFKEQRNIGFYAVQLQITENRLYHATMHVLGKSPKQLINDRVILEAKRLLVNSEKPVKEICFELGFDEPTNFNQFFKKHAGSAPNAFRKGV